MSCASWTRRKYTRYEVLMIALVISPCRSKPSCPFVSVVSVFEVFLTREEIGTKAETKPRDRYCPFRVLRCSRAKTAVDVPAWRFRDFVVPRLSSAFVITANAVRDVLRAFESSWLHCSQHDDHVGNGCQERSTTIERADQEPDGDHHHSADDVVPEERDGCERRDPRHHRHAGNQADERAGAGRTWKSNREDEHAQ